VNRPQALRNLLATLPRGLRDRITDFIGEAAVEGFRPLERSCLSLATATLSFDHHEPLPGSLMLDAPADHFHRFSGQPEHDAEDTAIDR
jgi:hypothetical protein